MKFYLTPIRMANSFLKASKTGTQDLLSTVVEVQTGAATMKTFWRFSKKVKTVLTYDPALPPQQEGS